MEKRALLAIVISIVILFFYNEFFLKKQINQTKSLVKKEKVNPAPVKEKKEKIPVKENVNVEKKEVIKPFEEKTIKVENELLKLEFTNRGGAIHKCILKKYYKTVEKKENVVLFDSLKYAEFNNEISINGKPLKNLEYTLENDEKSVFVKNKPYKLNFVYKKDGLTIKKIYTIFPDKYEVQLNYTVINNSKNDIKIKNKTIYYHSTKVKKRRYLFEGPSFLVDGVLKEVKLKKIRKEGVVEFRNKISWLGFSRIYFLSVMLKRGSYFDAGRTYIKGDQIVIEGEKNYTISANDFIKDVNSVYLGPKKYDILASYHAGLERSINFGIFYFLAKPLLIVLNWFYKFIPNYGIAIILLTILIKLIFYPLTNKSYESMKKMKELQPHIQRLKEMYKDDKVKLNQEVMALYKKYKVNPFGGCLPMIIQIPVFFALYKTLMVAIELRHAPFIKYLPFTHKYWLVDLSAKDPYYITPILMGISMYIQQKMTPTGGTDPIQEKIMLFMPVFLTFLFLNFPSGLVIYWLVNNILSIIQQYYVEKKFAKGSVKK